MDGSDGFPTFLEPLAGGHSGETFLSDIAGEQAVVRVYGLRSAHRGALAPEIDAAVLELVRGLLPVPAVLEVRRGAPDVDLPGLLVTSLLPGERLDVLLPTLSPEGLRTLGERLGVLAGRLGHMVQPRRGTFRRQVAPPRGRAVRQRTFPPGSSSMRARSLRTSSTGCATSWRRPRISSTRTAGPVRWASWTLRRTAR